MHGCCSSPRSRAGSTIECATGSSPNRGATRSPCWSCRGHSSATELAGGYRRPDAQPLATQIEQSFLRRIRTLPVDTRRLLLTAAAEPVGDVVLLHRAADQLGIGTDAAIEAEAAGLIDVGTRVRFRHPLVRSAAYRAGSPDDRQLVHRALAEATDPETDPDRRAWHRAHAAAAPDDAVATDLERSADAAGRAAESLPPAPCWPGPPS